MKYSDFKLKHFIAYGLIVFIGALLIRYEVFDVDDRIVLFPLVMICYAHFYYQKKLSKLHRVEKLEEYSKLGNYDFIEKPAQPDLVDFVSFKTLALIMDKDDKKAFMNLLIHQPRQKFNSVEKPKIVTVRKTHYNSGGPDKLFYTQVFLLESKKEIPHFFIEAKSFFGGIGDQLLHPYKKIHIEKYDFPKKKYNLYAHDQNIEKFFSSDFIELLIKGLEKNKRVNIESDGKNIIFYLQNQRFSGEGITFHTNLFQVLYKALNN